ncbi:hypothetical protein EDD18DRAFT_1346315 [Armillaria luteobubalina]|uniref:Uncharacterized protein n=1 Tax=Armillaria luteobubalina TaxID=153913 RepID=A0AA39QI99_9AGAR|nr:hypothetical protein EDD18DRAFT_1346315 [Armillaria luteobubalina]
MPKALQRRDRGPAHPYPRPPIYSPPSGQRILAHQDIVDPRVVAHAAAHLVPPNLVVPGEPALEGGWPIQWFKVMIAVAVVVVSVGYFAHRLFHCPWLRLWLSH